MRVRMYVSCSYCTFSLPSPLPRQLQSTMGDGGGSPPADKDKVEQLPKRSVSEQEASEYQVAAWGRVIVFTSHHHPPSLLSLMYTRRHLSTLVLFHGHPYCHSPSLSSSVTVIWLLSSLTVILTVFSVTVILLPSSPTVILLTVILCHCHLLPSSPTVLITVVSLTCSPAPQVSSAPSVRRCMWSVKNWFSFHALTTTTHAASYPGWIW